MEDSIAVWTERVMRLVRAAMDARVLGVVGVVEPWLDVEVEAAASAVAPGVVVAGSMENSRIAV